MRQLVCLKLPIFIAASITELIGEEGMRTLITLLRNNMIMEYPATALCAALGAVLLDNSKIILIIIFCRPKPFIFSLISPSVSNYSFWCSILLKQFVCICCCAQRRIKERPINAGCSACCSNWLDCTAHRLLC